VAKIRFWRWQQTDELGLPCPTRIRMPDVERKEAEHLDAHPGSVETWRLDTSRTDPAALGTPLK